ncbi:unnamed protein product, partial [Effrenium voratum]
TLAMSEPKGKGLSKGPRGPKGKGKAPGPPPRPPSRPPGKAPDGPKLRPLFWQTVGQVPTESVWSSLGPPVPFDTSLLERRFAMAEARAPRKAVDATGDEPKKKLRVLDDRTSQLLAISFNKLPPAEQLAQVVDTLETFPDGLAPEAVMALNSATVEQKDAVEQLKSLDVREADLMQLDVPERYLWVMANNSVCAAKIASGALIVGLAPELPELSLACQRVRDGCRRLQSSILVKRFISTCLAVGNVMNRGTARGSARAIVLPEGLLKLDELRGSGETEGVSGLSLLDFVSEAILVEASCTSGKGVQAQLRAEADELREGMRAAQGVCLHDADTSCQRICRAASHAQSGLSQHLANLSVARLAATVQSICKESEKCSAQVAEAKAQLKKSMEWASAKPNTSSSDWLGSWVQFLEQLAGAIDRVKLPELPMRPVQADCNGAASGRSVFQDVSNTPQMSHEDGKPKGPSPQVASKVQSVQLDDDERIEVLLARMAQGASTPACTPAPNQDADEVVRLLVHAGAKETANANGFTPLQLAEAGSSRLICSEWPICGDVRTVWDISFGTLRNPDCGGCEGFLRHVGCPAASAQIFRCVRCNCFSKDHLPVEGPQAEDPLQRLPGGGFRDSRGYGAAPAGQSRQQAAGWPGIGEMVWVPQQASVQKRAGIVVQTEASETSAFCTVELLAAHGVAEADRRQVVATECLTEWAPAWSPPRVQGDFDKEAHFKNLVFQPGGLWCLKPALKQRRCKVCVLGGSISLQSRGYRPHFVQALERRGVAVEDCPAAVGTAGSRPLSLVVSDLVLTKRPDLLIIEVAVNDGDDLLESTPHPNVVPILQAAEGIVRTVRRRCPGTAILFLEMFLREDEEARILKTGSEAWKDSSVEEAIGWYHDVAPLLHRHVCRHYGLAQIDLVPAFRSMSAEMRSAWFRDDCHHSDAGGEAVGNLLAKLVLWSVRQPELTGSLPKNALPAPLDAQCWCNGKTIRVLPGWLSPEGTPRKDKDLLRLGQQTDWLLLRAGGRVTIPFKGRACGILTLLGSLAASCKRCKCVWTTGRRRGSVFWTAGLMLSEALLILSDSDGIAFAPRRELQEMKALHRTFYDTVFRFSGSVLPKGALYALPGTILALALHLTWSPDSKGNENVEVGKFNDVWGAYTFSLGFLIVFRNNQAYNRYWEGASKIHEICADLYNCVSQLFAFCSQKGELRDKDGQIMEANMQHKVDEFQHEIICFVSLLFASCLSEISGNSLDVKVIRGIDPDCIRGESRCEVVAHWICKAIINAKRAQILDIDPPILSRALADLASSIADIYRVRKIKDVPFPVAYSQMVLVMLVVYSLVTPLLASQLIELTWMATTATFCVTAGFWSLYHIADEIDQPFGTDQNDLPLEMLAAEFIDSLKSLRVQTHQMPRVTYEEERGAKGVLAARCSERNAHLPTKRC